MMEVKECCSGSCAEKKTNCRKCFLLGFLLFVLVGAGLFFVGYQLAKINQLKNSPVISQVIPKSTPTPDPTGSWKTYINNKSEFSFQYPGSWQLITESGSLAVRSDKDKITLQVIRYNVSDLPKGYTNIAGWFEDFKNGEKKAFNPNDGYYRGPGSDTPYKWYQYYETSSFTERKIDGISSIVAVGLGTGVSYVVVPTKNYIYEIIINPISAYKNATIDQILSTFKFL